MSCVTTYLRYNKEEKVRFLVYSLAIVFAFSFFTLNELVTHSFMVKLLVSVSYYGSYFFVLLANVCVRHVDKKWVALICSLFALSIYFYYAYGYFYVFHVLLITASKGVPRDVILRLCYKTMCLLLLLCTFLLLFGFVDNHQVAREFYGMSMNINTMGFRHYSGFGFRFLACAYLYLYFNRHKLSIRKILFYSLGSIVVFTLNGTRLQVVNGFIFLLLSILVYKYRVISFSSKMWGKVAVLSYPLALVVFALVGLAVLGSDKFYAFWDEQFSGRMQLTTLAYATYGINWFGNKIKMVGATQHELTGEDVFYIDAGYAYWPLALGIVFTVFLIASYTSIFFKSYKYQARFIYLWSLVFLFSNFINDFFHFFIANPMLLLLLCDFQNLKLTRRTAE